MNNPTADALEMVQKVDPLGMRHTYTGRILASKLTAVILTAQAQALKEEVQRIESASPNHKSAALFMLCWSGPLEEKITTYLKAAEELTL